jgi:hypothetical protein
MSAAKGSREEIDRDILVRLMTHNREEEDRKDSQLADERLLGRINLDARSAAGQGRWGKQATAKLLLCDQRVVWKPKTDNRTG